MTLFQDTPVFRRRFCRFALVPGVAVLVAAAVRYAMSTEARDLLAAAGIFVLAGVWCVWYWRRLRARARVVLVKTRGLTCLSCGFSLVGLDENGHCPECGASYYADHLARCWSNAAGFPEADSGGAPRFDGAGDRAREGGRTP